MSVHCAAIAYRAPPSLVLQVRHAGQGSSDWRALEAAALPFQACCEGSGGRTFHFVFLRAVRFESAANRTLGLLATLRTTLSLEYIVKLYL